MSWVTMIQIVVLMALATFSIGALISMHADQQIKIELFKKHGRYSDYLSVMKGKNDSKVQ